MFRTTGRVQCACEPRDSDADDISEPLSSGRHHMGLRLLRIFTSLNGDSIAAVPMMASAVYTPNMAGTEEVALIRQILAGRRDLFANLIAPPLKPLLRIVQATLGGHPDVEDIVQQTALKALTHPEQF